MTAVQSGDIPSGALASLEALVTWAASALCRVNPLTSSIEVAGGKNERVAQFNVIRGDAPAVDRIVFRISVPLGTDWQTSTTKLWTQVTEVGTTAIPSAYKSN